MEWFGPYEGTLQPSDSLLRNAAVLIGWEYGGTFARYFVRKIGEGFVVNGQVHELWLGLFRIIFDVAGKAGSPAEGQFNSRGAQAFNLEIDWH